MFNPEALSCSERNLDAQIEFTLEALPFIRQITPVDNSINMLKDYFYECDAVGIGASSINYNIFNIIIFVYFIKIVIYFIKRFFKIIIF